jgi:peptidoglycan/xylan/chitin deacetylase (PgdA/CDA1 family)
MAAERRRSTRRWGSGPGREGFRQDELRGARLLLGDERAELGPSIEVLRAPAMRAAVRARPVPSRPVRVAQQLMRKLGRLDYEGAVAAPLDAARREALGASAERPPRFLVRVDEFPHYLAWDDPKRYGSERYRRFHAIMAAAGVPYLVAVPPRVSRAPLDPDGREWRALEPGERGLLAEIAGDGVAFGLHGRDHRTRFASPRRHSELCGLGAHATETLLREALAELAPLGIAPEVFVPPYNRFDASQYAEIARLFSVVCGGPESIGQVGFQRAPVWRGQAVYLPSYFPLYGHAREVLPAARRMIERKLGLWTPIVLHWGWEADDGWSELERLVESIAPHTAHWDEFLAAVRTSAAPSDVMATTDGDQP